MPVEHPTTVRLRIDAPTAPLTSMAVPHVSMTELMTKGADAPSMVIPVPQSPIVMNCTQGEASSRARAVSKSAK